MSTSIRISIGAPAVGIGCVIVSIASNLNTKRKPVNDVQIRSVGYDRRRGRLEIEFIWTNDVRQFYPVAPAAYRQLLAAKPMYLFLNRILKPQVIRFDYVRTEAKRAIMMAGIANELLHCFDGYEPT